MFSRTSLFFVLTVFVFCDSSVVDNLDKCKINDGPCQAQMIQSVIRDIAKTGIPELGIPQIDPIALNNVSVSVMDFLDITMVQGSVKGVKDCTVDKFDTNIKEERSYMELTCDVSIKGQYKLFSSSPTVKSLFGGDSLHGEGNGKVKIEKLKLKFDLFFFIQRRNGELYIKCKPDKRAYTFDVKGKVTFFADNIYIGKQESSKLVVGLLNQNWRALMASFGKPFADKAVEIVYDFVHRFFDAVPAKNFILDDLTPYARDE